MKRALAGRLVLVTLVAFAQDRTFAAGPDQVLSDASGREISRTRSNADGSSHRTVTSYGDGSAKTTVSEDLNSQGQATRRVVEQVDSAGRIAQRKEVTIGENGRETGKRLSYKYDADGRQRVTTEIVQ